jgi:Na+-translocating ferredoxin:NAD+ oxidoreductase RnfD subunit
MTADALTPRRLHGAPADGAAAMTGLIFTLSCPVGIPFWLLILLCFADIWVVREPFGGIGSNLFNPAMGARALLLLLFPALLGGYTADGISAATPLSVTAPDTVQLLQWAVGRRNGSMGETSLLMIAAGYGVLVWRRVVRPYIPLITLAAFAAVIAVGGGNVMAHLLSGSIVFGAVYIFTDYASRPATPWGEVLFAAGAGALTALFRLYGRYPEGVCFAALAMNAVAPLLTMLTI